MIEIDMGVLESINSKYNFKVKQISSNSALVTTGLNEWIIEVGKPAPYKKHIVLKHKNTGRNKNKWHIQREFYDLKWTMGHINYHDKARFKLPYKK